MPRIKGVKTNKIVSNKNKEQFHEEIKNSIQNYFEKNIDHLNKLYSITNGEDKITIEMIKWFFDNYINENMIFVKDEPLSSKYKTTIKCYSKKNFNIVGGKKIKIKIKDKIICASIAQLNFFKWALKDNMIEIIEKDYDNILLKLKLNNIQNEEI